MATRSCLAYAYSISANTSFVCTLEFIIYSVELYKNTRSKFSSNSPSLNCCICLFNSSDVGFLFNIFL